VYSRADLSRIATLAVALFLTAVSANAVAREFGASGTERGDRPTVQAPHERGRLIAPALRS
jgi:hypothetical protein